MSKRLVVRFPCRAASSRQCDIHITLPLEINVFLRDLRVDVQGVAKEC